MKERYCYIFLICVLSIVVCMLYTRITKSVDGFNFKAIVPYKPLIFESDTEKSAITNILIFNSIAYKNDEIPAFAKIGVKINEMYAHKFGYDFKIICHKVDEMPPYWLRVKDSLVLLNTSNYDYIMYMDLDAVFNDFNHSIGQLLEAAGDYDMYICQDIGFSNKINSLLNTGCFIIKNSDWSRQFIKTWLNSCFDEDSNVDGMCIDSWRFDKSSQKWSCDNCAWAGYKYEQGSLANLYLNNVLSARKRICIFTYDVFCNVFPTKPSFVLHMMGMPDLLREIGFSKKIKEIEKKLPSRGSNPGQSGENRVSLDH